MRENEREKKRFTAKTNPQQKPSKKQPSDPAMIYSRCCNLAFAAALLASTALAQSGETIEFNFDEAEIGAVPQPMFGFRLSAAMDSTSESTSIDDYGAHSPPHSLRVRNAALVILPTNRSCHFDILEFYILPDFQMHADIRFRVDLNDNINMNGGKQNKTVEVDDWSKPVLFKVGEDGLLNGVKFTNMEAAMLQGWRVDTRFGSTSVFPFYVDDLKLRVRCGEVTSTRTISTKSTSPTGSATSTAEAQPTVSAGVPANVSNGTAATSTPTPAPSGAGVHPVVPTLLFLSFTVAMFFV